MISASTMAANMWKNSLKNAESDNNKILYETLLDFFLQRNCTYFLNKPRRWYCERYHKNCYFMVVQVKKQVIEWRKEEEGYKEEVDNPVPQVSQ